MGLLSFSVLPVWQWGFQWPTPALAARPVMVASRKCPEPQSWALRACVPSPPSPRTETSSAFCKPVCRVFRLHYKQVAEQEGIKGRGWCAGCLPKAASAHRSTLQGMLWQMLGYCLLWDCRSIFPGSSFSLSVSCYSFTWCSPCKVPCCNLPIHYTSPSSLHLNPIFSPPPALLRQSLLFFSMRYSGNGRRSLYCFSVLVFFFVQGIIFFFQLTPLWSLGHQKCQNFVPNGIL